MPGQWKEAASPNLHGHMHEW